MTRRVPNLRIAASFDSKNYTDRAAYNCLIDDFQYREDDSHRVSVSLPDDRTVSTFQYYEQHSLDHYRRKWPLDVRHFGYAKSLDDILYGNSAPAVIRDCLAPKYFSDYPSGRIVYVAYRREALHSAWAIDNQTAEKLKLSAAYAGPQPFSGLGMDSLPYHALVWFSTLFFPHVLFAVKAPYTGFLLFFTGKPVKYDGWGDGLRLSSLIFDELSHVFGDDRNPGRDQRYVFPNEPLDISSTMSLLTWWIAAVSKRMDNLLSSQDSTTASLVALTMNRILVESTLLNVSFNHLQRKTLFLSVVDKWANLLANARGRKDEVRIWREILSRNFVSSRIKPFLRKLDSPLGELLSRMASYAVDNLAIDGLRPQLLRVYRNTAHGYSIRDAALLLKHDLPINNDVPDLASLLVLYLLGGRSLDPLNKIKISI